MKGRQGGDGLGWGLPLGFDLRARARHPLTWSGGQWGSLLSSAERQRQWGLRL